MNSQLARRNGRRLAVIAVFLVTCWLLAWRGAAMLVVNAPLTHVDAIVVLSGSATYSERAHKAAELYRAGLTRKIILTNDNRQGGWSSAQQRNPFFYERARDELLQAGTPSEVIEVLLQPVSSTYDEAVLLKTYALDHKLHSIMIVTSAYHSRRALWTFRRVFGTTGIEIGLDAVEPGIQTPPTKTWWLHTRGWQIVPLEHIKLIYYYLRFDDYESKLVT